MADQTPAEQAVNWKVIGAQLSEGFLTEGVPGFLKAWQAAHIETNGAVRALDMDLTEDIASRAGQLLHALEEPFLPVIAAFVAPILGGLFGAEVDENAFHRRMRAGEGNRGALAIVEGFMRAIVGDAAAEIEPSDAGSKRIAGAAVQASLETEFNAIVPEILSHLLPFNIGHWEDLTKLPEGIIQSLGVSRLVRRALQPIVTTTCTTPATWHMHKLHRPTLLGAGETARQLARGRWSREKAVEELARAGYSDDRIEALLNSVAKFRSVSDAFRLVRAGQWSHEQAVQHLKDQGYDDEGAETELTLEKLKLIESFERALIDAAVNAYVGGRIERTHLSAAVQGMTLGDQERAQLLELAEARRAFARKGLTLGQTEAMVKSGVLSVIDYRHAAEREGYDDDAVAALELQLRYELDREKGIERHRAEQEAARLAEQQARAAAAAARKAEVEKQRALERRGTEADLERAVIRGLIPIARLEELYAARYDADTVAILVDLVEADRLAYVAQQDARDQALKRAGRRAVDVGMLEEAVFENLLTLDEFRARLVALGFDAGDAELLRATLEARKRDRDAATTARIAAGAAAKKRKIDLGRFEDLVRRGHRTLAQYDALLESLGFEDAARAGMTELLELQIADDTKARAERAAAEARLKAKGLSLEQFRRAVLLTIKTVDQFQTFLVDQGFTADAQRVLVAELRADVAEAEVARSRRAEAEARSEARAIPLADVRRAARLGVISVDAYRDRLDREGYTDEDVDVEIDLLVVEMAEAAATRAKAEAAARAAADRGLSLAQVARLVKFGLRSIDDYRAAVAAVYPNTADIEDLVTALQQELAALDAARVRRDQVESELATRDLSLSQLEAAVKDGLTTLDDYYAELLGLGYGTDDAELLTVLLADRLDAAAAKRTA